MDISVLSSKLSAPEKYKPLISDFKKEIEREFQCRVAYIDCEYVRLCKSYDFLVYMFSGEDYNKISIVDGKISDINERKLDSILSEIIRRNRYEDFILKSGETFHCYIQRFYFELQARECWYSELKKYTVDLEKMTLNNADRIIIHNGDVICLFDTIADIDRFIDSGLLKELNNRVISVLSSMDDFGFVKEDENHVFCDTTENFQKNPMYLRDI